MSPASTSIERRAVLHALAAIGLWATLAVLGCKLGHVPPFLLVGGALLLGAACGLRSIRASGVRPAVVLLGVYGLFAYHFCLFLSLRLAPAVEANLINYLWPLLIVLLSPLVIAGTTLTRRHVAGAALGFGGAALLLGGGKLGYSPSGTLGYLLALAAAIIWSTYSLLSKRFGGSAVATSCLVSGVLSLVCHALFEPRYRPAPTDVPWWLLMGFGPMGAAFYLWDRALRRGDPRIIGTLAYMTPLLSTALLAIFGGARVSVLTLAAMALIVGGALVGTWSMNALVAARAGDASHPARYAPKGSRTRPPDEP